MVKHRLMGTKEELITRIKQIERNKSIEVKSISAFFPIKGSGRYYRIYIEEENRQFIKEEN